jgi:hypothetical protein
MLSSIAFALMILANAGVVFFVVNEGVKRYANPQA